MIAAASSAKTGTGTGLPGRLTKGAGTHLASWLQEVQALDADEAQALLDNAPPARSTVRGERALAKLFETHGKKAGHSKKITDVAHSGDLLVAKDSSSMRLWRAHGDCALLRVVSCRGPHVAFHSTGQFIVTGLRQQQEAGAAADNSKDQQDRARKVWGPGGGSAFTAGKKDLTTATRKARARP